MSTTDNKPDKGADEKIPPPVLSRRPEREIEERVKKHPEDADAKADLGSDESMDASDPSAAAQPGSDDEPVPSSGFPEEPLNSELAANQLHGINSLLGCDEP